MFNYNDRPEEVAAAIRERHRSGAEIAARERPIIAKEDARRRQVLSDIDRKYSKGAIPANARLYYDSAAGSDNCLSLIDGALTRWQNLSADDVKDGLGRWPVDINRAEVLNNDLANTFTMARTKAAAIRETVQKLQDVLAFEESEAKRLGVSEDEGTWTISPAPVSETPRAVVVESAYSPLRK